MKQFLANHLKNIKGWKTKRKLVAFAVDDYGNVRLANLRAKKRLEDSGVALIGRFDRLDALDTREDYEMLFDVLDSVKDHKGNPAVFTPYALPCNVDFEKTSEANTYIPEKLTVTYEKLSAEDTAFAGAYPLLLKGIASKMIKPQFHGREHLNINVFNAHLRDKNPIVMANLNQHSLVSVPMHPDFPGIRFSYAYAFWKNHENEAHKKNIAEGLKLFEEVYGYSSLTFTPPAQQLASDLYPYIASLGVRGVDKMRQTKRHKGEGVYVSEKNRLGEKGPGNTIAIVRNCVFEPNQRPIDWVNFTFKQIEAAFFWNKPAIISSHRVNFSGHIDPANRKKGLEDLKNLLNESSTYLA
ncbi:hypothetical protein A3SI_06704 [Nitritalea halalkaliphila LW7]|uniref:Polysaccharide deacetylase n=1 Tax=Nitritalea halalkaliphila LW7 TaxID=1189621 RepID=I5C604_9BACT|nr:hypothetical protein [Nitritalea halalkaliphila]EIM77256.1 hypothetical protein A3SI_06704 [Nitritalea halalkaliphila LW7]